MTWGSISLFWRCKQTWRFTFLMIYSLTVLARRRVNVLLSNGRFTVGASGNSTDSILIVEPSSGSGAISCATFGESSLSTGSGTSFNCTQSAPFSNDAYTDNSSIW
ncbi:hypothetical protein OIDMADRAFT_59602 [Oidiodendron maius Zn]|uniref:Uncharacterized protein n=1 Tax=Oidiodendron maius (strain Zn) TaxID=913774 RepID=A0A0C3GZZ2_OIDMZ|nr:hypothetical protein OIDMADRAFT_59602 [Oidiodendron maius Zn]